MSDVERPKILYAPYKSYEEQEKAERSIREAIESDVSVDIIADDETSDNIGNIISDVADTTAVVNFLKEKER